MKIAEAKIEFERAVSNHRRLPRGFNCDPVIEILFENTDVRPDVNFANVEETIAAYVIDLEGNNFADLSPDSLAVVWQKPVIDAAYQANLKVANIILFISALIGTIIGLSIGILQGFLGLIFGALFGFLITNLQGARLKSTNPHLVFFVRHVGGREPSIFGLPISLDYYVLSNLNGDVTTVIYVS